MTNFFLSSVLGKLNYHIPGETADTMKRTWYVLKAFRNLKITNGSIFFIHSRFIRRNTYFMPSIAIVCLKILVFPLEIWRQKLEGSKWARFSLMRMRGLRSHYNGVHLISLRIAVCENSIIFFWLISLVNNSSIRSVRMTSSFAVYAEELLYMCSHASMGKKLLSWYQFCGIRSEISCLWFVASSGCISCVRRFL